MITMIFDTGATGSMISLKICKLARSRIYQSSHLAVLADGNSQLTVAGDIYISMIMEGGLLLPLSTVVVTKLKAGLIVGMKFMRENKVIIGIPDNKLRFPNNHSVHFNNSLGNPKLPYCGKRLKRKILTCNAHIPNCFLVLVQGKMKKI